MLSTDKPLALVDATGRGLQIDTYESPLAMVLDLLDSGRLGGSDAWIEYGGPEHCQALEQIAQEVSRVRTRIAEHAREERRARGEIE